VLQLTMPHLSLSPLDPAAFAIIDQSSNTSNHFLFECIQAVRERRILMLGVARRDVPLPCRRCSNGSISTQKKKRDLHLKWLKWRKISSIKK
jgi:hypothetical protein